jgi:hypothetical protein
MIRDAGLRHTAALDLIAFGKCEEVFEAMRRDEYVGGQMLPYVRNAALLSWTAMAVFIWAVFRGRVRVIGVMVGIANYVSAWWFVLLWGMGLVLGG